MLECWNDHLNGKIKDHHDNNDDQLEDNVPSVEEEELEIEDQNIEPEENEQPEGDMEEDPEEGPKEDLEEFMLEIVDISSNEE